MSFPHQTDLQKLLPGVPLDKAWEIIENLPDDIRGKDFKTIIKAIFDKDGKTKIKDMQDIKNKLSKTTDNDALFEWIEATVVLKQVRSTYIRQTKQAK